MASIFRLKLIFFSVLLVMAMAIAGCTSAPVTDDSTPPTPTPSPTPSPAPTSPPVVSPPRTQALIPTVIIVTPVDGAAIVSGSIQVSVEIMNFNLVPPSMVNAVGEGHIHYYLDVDIPTTQGQPAVTAPGTYKATTATSITWDNVTPGTHTLGVQLVNNNHTPLSPPVITKVTVTVSAITSSTSRYELNVVSHLNITAGPGHITDVWAHTASDGKSYAYLGSFDQPFCSLEITGVHIIDISDPTNPQKVGFIPSPASTRANDVKVEHIDTSFFSGDVLVHSVEFCSDSSVPPESAGIVIHDVTDPLTPKLLAQDFLNFQVHNIFIFQQGDHAFVLVVEDGAIRDFHIVDITNPTRPREVSVRGWIDWFDPATDQLFLGQFALPLLHDVWAQSYPDDLPNPAFAGKTIAYLSYWDAGLVLLDISDPANPIFLGDSDYLDPDPLSGEPPEGNSHAAVPTADGALVFMGDEDFTTLRMVFTVDDGEFAGEFRAMEGEFTVPLEELENQAMNGPTTFVGLACSGDDIPPPTPAILEPGEEHIAVIERGICPFDVKIANVAAAGYGGAVVFNQQDVPGQVIVMSGDPNQGTIPAVFVSRFTGFAILGISPTSPPNTPLPPIGAPSSKITTRGGVFDGWGYGRILDVRDPSNIVELGQFATENVFAQPVPPGDHTMHNVIVEERQAYISWYSDGIRVVDFQDPTEPKEIARFIDPVSGSNFWGVFLFKHPDGNTFILGSDRDTGLWILEAP
jgi:hypothetical protein